ncbi:hypothetical protein [Reinekea blandensis]|uniref:Uncharacterized protein n=1 Tax=Reinekea blandensis MED297 TaxID=314283 RepID=A4BEK5_9GAMM|nr:hypothetical protein [Reinekea blandensis]EAR09432.1 hypothetical protein MED297_02392 [Reinekea sp. MED297] [Reinekea blandensis MED297]
MYIDPLTLFILGEFLVVYIIINVFLFYKGRLYNVLVALLKEMRFEKLRRQQEKQKEMAALRESNKGLLSKNRSLTETVKSAGKTIPEQLEERIASLHEDHPMAKDLLNSIELDESAQWLRLRILELEKELLSGAISEERWEELATEAISRLQSDQASHQQSLENRRDNAEEERYTGQLENDLGEAQRLFEDAKIRIRQLEDELENLKTINKPSDNLLETPSRGLYEDEIYRLKCDNFDLHESINKLKLELQQSGATIGSDEYTALLETQLANMEQYIKSADIASGLMEKELSAANAEIQTLENQLSNLGTASDTIDLAPLKELGEQEEAKTDTLSSIKETITRLKNGEAPEAVAAEQEAHIARLENIILQSNQCIAVLESELSQASRDKARLEDKLDQSKADLLAAKLSELSDTSAGQKQGMNSIRDIIEDMRGGSDLETALNKQETEISRLEGFLTESDTLIGQLETEIEDLNARLEAALSSPAAADSDSESTRPNSDEDLEEMEALLQQFISDIQGLMRQINLLDDRNKKQQVQINQLQTDLEQERQQRPESTTDTLLEDDDVPIMTDIELDQEPES